VLLDATWKRRFTTCWSIPLTEGKQLAGVMQFGFKSFYEWLPREQELLSAAAERCLAIAERAAGLAQLRPHPHRTHAAKPWVPPPPPTPPPPPPVKYNPPPPGDEGRIPAIMARRRLALYEKLCLVAPENRPPRQRTPPAGKTTP